MAITKKTKNNKCCEDVKKIKNRTTIWSSNFTSEYLLKENKITNVKRYTTIFLAALFTRAKIWSNLNIWWVDKDVVYTFNGMVLSHFIKRNLAFYDNIDGPRGYHLNEINQRQILCDFTYIWNLKIKTEADLKRTNEWLPEGRVFGGWTNMWQGLRGINFRL